MKSEEGNPKIILPTASAAMETAEPDIGGKSESGCYSRCAHEGIRETSGPRCSSQALQDRYPRLANTVSELGLMVSCVEPTASTQRIFGCFLGTWNSFLQEALYHPKDIGVPSTFRGGMAAWLGVRVFRMVEVFTGFCMPCVPPEAGAKSHRASVLYCELTIGGLGMWRKRVVLRN